MIRSKIPPHTVRTKPWVYLAFASILIVAALLRFTKLSEIPPGVNRDEASIGYTAYSILRTGKDEYGRFLPISFESFGDWKLPLYIYLTVPSVAAFGLNEFAVRFPSALAGTLAVFLTYFLVLELFNDETRSPKHETLALLSALLLAVSPWHIHLSRVESESNLAVFLVTLAVLLLVWSIRKKPGLLPISAFFFGLTYWTYHGNHIFTTLLIVVMCVLFVRKIFRNPYIGVSALILVVLSGIILSVTILGADKTKIAGISIFSDPMTVHEEIERPRSAYASPQALEARIFHNRVVYAVETVAQNYIRSFSPEFLFIRGGTNRAHNIENFGNMYLVEAPFLLLGIFFLMTHRKQTWAKLILIWIAISPIAASITKDAPHTNRMFAIYPMPAIISAMGIIYLFSLTDSVRRAKYLIITGIVLFYAANVSVYLERYFVQFPYMEAKYWGVGYKQLSAYLSTSPLNGKRVVITHPEYSPYIFLLFYQRTDPAFYQKSVTRYEPTEDAFVHVKGFGNNEFRPIDWKNDVSNDTVLVDVTDEVPQWVVGNIPVHPILLPDGTSQFSVFTPL